MISAAWRCRLWAKLAPIQRICLLVFTLTVILDLGRGVARYKSVLGFTGQRLIDTTEYDARVHVTIAQRILNGQGFTLPLGIGGPPEVQPAFLKAPGYPYLLAALFRFTGISYSFFPIQCVFGGLLSVLVVLISMEVFGDPLAALVAGLGAALNPILINSAAQFYNENIYFFMFFLVLWLYLRWWSAPSAKSALLCGLAAGLTALMRELMLGPFAALTLLALVRMWPKSKLTALTSAAWLSAGLLLPILPWTIRNYMEAGVVVPISTISGYTIGAGNNACVAVNWNVAFYGDAPCSALDQRRYALLAEWHKEPRVVFNDRAYRDLGLAYIRGHVGEYLKLCFRRAWTIFDPWHPAQGLDHRKKTVMLLYFLAFVAPGLIGAAWLPSRGVPSKAWPLYVALIASYAPLAVIFVSHDHRYAIGIHLILAMFAGVWMAYLFRGTKRVSS